MNNYLDTLPAKQRVDYLISPLLIKIWKQKEPEAPENFEGFYLGNNLIILKDYNQQHILHETAHYLSFNDDEIYNDLKKGILDDAKTNPFYYEFSEFLRKKGYPEELIDEEFVAYAIQFSDQETLKNLHPLFNAIIEGTIHINTEEEVTPSCLGKLNEYFDIKKLRTLIFLKQNRKIFQEVKQPKSIYTTYDK